MAPDNNLERVKPFYKIEVKSKTKYKTFWATYCEISTSYVHLKGVELTEETDVKTHEQACLLLQEKETVEKYYPWSSIVEMELKRFLKKTE